MRLGFWFLILLLGACSSAENPKTENPKNASSVRSQIIIADYSQNSDTTKKEEQNLWHYIANRYALEGYHHPNLEGHIRWFLQNPDYLTRVSKRAEPYLYLITRAVEKAGLPIEIALLPIVESAYHPFSYSAGAASGLWQFIPATAKLYGLEDDWWFDKRRDVIASTNAAIQYLKNLEKLFAGDWLLAIAAYNSGPGRVQNAIKKNRAQGLPTDFWHLRLPLETRGYVPRLLAVATLIQNPQQYGQKISAVANKPYLQKINLDSQLDIALIAKWTGLDVKTIYMHNPGLNRWATPEKFQLLLPIEKTPIFLQKLAAYPQEKRIKWHRHKIAAGETLSQIAKKYQTTVAAVKAANELKSDAIRSGDYLIVPGARQRSAYYELSEAERSLARIGLQRTGKKIIHTVRAGESLWSIARKYGTQISYIVKWNHLEKSDILPIGKKLVIWQKQSRAETPRTIFSRTIFYRIRAGDNLSKIAKKFGVRVSDLENWNNLKKNEILKIGQKLKIITSGNFGNH